MAKAAYRRKAACRPVTRGFSLPPSYRKTLTSAIAVATMLAMPVANKARAQVNPAFNITTNNATNITQGGTTTAFEITAPTAIITYDGTVAGTGAVDFLPSGSTLRFENDPSLQSNYTVLNRILVTGEAGRQVAINGSVVAKLLDINSQEIGNGGRVWFYTPGGLLIGGGATFDVGGLLLTTGDPTINGGTEINPNGAIALNTTGTTNGVIISSGATLNVKGNKVPTNSTTPDGTFNPAASYLAVVSPFVQQASNAVTVDGTAAYVTGEQVNLTINQGLFDISVPVGSNDTVLHTGSTLWDSAAASDNPALPRRILLVSVPKTTAIELLVNQGRLGFNSSEAVSASQAANGTIILAAGHNIVAGNVGGVAGGGGDAVATIDGGQFDGNTIVRARQFANVNGSSSGTDFAGDITVKGGSQATVRATGSGQALTVGGNLVVDASVVANMADTSVTGGNAEIVADSGGSISIAGGVSVIADANGCIGPSCFGTGASDYKFVTTTAGQARVFVDDGDFLIGAGPSTGNLSL
jgi:filamentous hemagglutinin family protein